MTAEPTYIGLEDRDRVTEAAFLAKVMGMTGEETAKFYGLTVQEWEDCRNFEKPLTESAIARYKPLLANYDACVAVLLESHNASHKLLFSGDEDYLDVVKDVRGDLNKAALIKANEEAIKKHLKQTERDRKARHEEAKELYEIARKHIDDKPSDIVVLLDK